MHMSSTDLDDFSDLDFDDEVDEFADLDEYAEPEVVVASNHIDFDKPLCRTCGFGDGIPGPRSNSKCQRCGKPWAWDVVVEEAPKAKRKKDETPQPIMSGHCNTPQSDNPHLSHERCTNHGAGSRANPEKRFHPCPCPCHLAHEVTEESEIKSRNPDGTWGSVLIYQCGGCNGYIAEAPVYGVDDEGEPVYVHVNKHTGRMLYTGPCR